MVIFSVFYLGTAENWEYETQENLPAFFFGRLLFSFTPGFTAVIFAQLLDWIAVRESDQKRSSYWKRCLALIILFLLVAFTLTAFNVLL